MRNQKLAEDYVLRAEKRIEALKALMRVEAWADVVRESQECVELALKALIRAANIEVPRVHDVSEVLETQKASLPKVSAKTLARMIEVSRRLRRDRELAFYGSEDLTPSEFYKRADAQQAFEDAIFVVNEVLPLAAPGRNSRKP